MIGPLLARWCCVLRGADSRHLTQRPDVRWGVGGTLLRRKAKEDRTMRDFGYWVRRIGAAWSAVLLSAVLGGCTGWPGGGPASGTTTGAAGGATSGTAGGVTQHVPASALLVVTNGPSPAASVSEL